MEVTHCTVEAEACSSGTRLMALSAIAWVNHYSISEIGDIIFHTKDKL